MLSEKEREFVRDYQKMQEDFDDDGFREKWNYDYERVLQHRLRKKYCKIVRDLFLLETFLSAFEKGELFYEYMIDEKTRGEEEEAQRLITFYKSLQDIENQK